MPTRGKQPRSHPIYGYDLDKVPEKLCLICAEPIGAEEYVEITTCARFGQMMFRHKKCPFVVWVKRDAVRVTGEQEEW